MHDIAVKEAAEKYLGPGASTEDVTALAEEIQDCVDDWFLENKDGE